MIESERARQQLSSDACFVKKDLWTQKIFRFKVSSKMVKVVKIVKQCDFGAMGIEPKPYGKATMTYGQKNIQTIC